MSLELTHILTVVGAVILMAIAERRRLVRLFRRYAPLEVSAPVLAQPTAPVIALPSDPRQLVNQRGLTLTCWSFLLNDQPDRAPHVLLVGPSGAGKTTFTRALLARRNGQMLVLTPKPDDDWGGAPVVTIDDDGSFTTMATACAALSAEVRRRLVAGKRRLPVGEALTIVCDDFPVIISEVGRPAAALFKLVGRLGRSLRVRLIVLSQSDRVKALGLSGEGDATDNYLRVDLARGHRATIHLDGYALPLDTQDIPALAATLIAPERGWDVSMLSGQRSQLTPSDPVHGTGDDDADLRPFQEVLTGIPTITGDKEPERTDTVPADGFDAETINALHLAGWSMNRIAAKMTRGNKQQRLERIHRALGQPST